MGKYNLTVYGAKEKCASCVHLPSAEETFEWLEAAIRRKYPNIHMTFQYIDIEQQHLKGRELEWVEKIQMEEYFYPLVVLNDEVVAEGNPRLKKIFEKIEEDGQWSR